MTRKKTAASAALYMDLAGMSERQLLLLVLDALSTQDLKIDNHTKQGALMAKKMDEYASDFKKRSDDLTTDVNELKALNTNAIASLQGQSAKITSLMEQNAAQKKEIDDLKAAGGTLTPEVENALNNVLASLDAQNAVLDQARSDLAAAVTANQPA